MNHKLKAMRNNNTCTSAFIFAFLVFFGLFVQFANAQQSLYNTVSTPRGLSAESEGNYLIKDGELDEIYSLKFILPSAQLKTLHTDSLIGKKKIMFEQTRVMVLPIMGMVHCIGMLNIEGIRSATSFHLGFSINSDQSITFKGTKLFKLSDFDENLSKEELKLDIDFILKSSKNNLPVLTTKK